MADIKKYIVPMETIVKASPKTKGCTVFEMKNIDKMYPANGHTTYDIVKKLAEAKSIHDPVPFDFENKYIATDIHGRWVSIPDETEIHLWYLWLIRLSLGKEEATKIADQKLGDDAEDVIAHIFNPD